LVQGGAFVQGNLGDPKLLDRLFKKHAFDAVMHFAAFSQVGESMNQPLMYYRNNLAKRLPCWMPWCAMTSSGLSFHPLPPFTGNRWRFPLPKIIRARPPTHMETPNWLWSACWPIAIRPTD
jgi:hypothetical protein